jgi:hypothetical protein
MCRVTPQILSRTSFAIHQAAPWPPCRKLPRKNDEGRCPNGGRVRRQNHEEDREGQQVSSLAGLPPEDRSLTVFFSLILPRRTHIGWVVGWLWLLNAPLLLLLIRVRIRVLPLLLVLLLPVLLLLLLQLVIILLLLLLLSLLLLLQLLLLLLLLLLPLLLP